MTSQRSATTAGAYKGAVLLAALGMELAAPVLSHLTEDEVTALLREMARLRVVCAEERDLVLGDFEQSVAETSDAIPVSPDYGRRILEEALGQDKAAVLLERSEPGEQEETVASVIAEVDPAALAGLVSDEHPQIVALVAGQLPVDGAAVFLSSLPAALRGGVAARLAELEPASPAVLRHLARSLREKMASGAPASPSAASSGPRRVADILARMRRATEEMVLSSMQEESPELAEQVNRHRFTFEDLLGLEDRSLQRILRDAEPETLPLVMRGLDEERQQILYRNMSERAADRLREDVDSMAPVRLRSVEAAQQQLVGLARDLQERGEIALRTDSGADSADGEDDALV